MTHCTANKGEKNLFSDSEMSPGKQALMFTFPLPKKPLRNVVGILKKRSAMN